MIRDLHTSFTEHRSHHTGLAPGRTADFEVVVDSYEEYQELIDYIQKFNYRNATVETVSTQPQVTLADVRSTAEVFKQTLLQATDDRQVPLFKPENIITYAPVATPDAAQPVVSLTLQPEPETHAPASLTAATKELLETPARPKVQVSAEVESPKLINDVLFLFEEDCKKIKDMPSALKVWKDHAGAIKKLAEPDKLRGSNTLALRLSEVLNVEPEEAKELFRAAMSGKKVEAVQPPPEPVAAPAVVVGAPIASPVANAPSEAANGVLEALAAEPKPILGLAVKHACTQLKTEQGVSA